jgi:hypothetical protein
MPASRSSSACANRAQGIRFAERIADGDVHPLGFDRVLTTLLGLFYKPHHATTSRICGLGTFKKVIVNVVRK